jgi:hypothetical protein
MMFIPSFMKIGQMVQILLEESETWWYHEPFFS